MKGLGDLVAVITKYTGIRFVVDKVFSILGRDCGCSARQDAWNKAVPFSHETLTEEETETLDKLFKDNG